MLHNHESNSALLDETMCVNKGLLSNRLELLLNKYRRKNLITTLRSLLTTFGASLSETSVSERNAMTIHRQRLVFLSKQCRRAVLLRTPSSLTRSQSDALIADLITDLDNLSARLPTLLAPKSFLAVLRNYVLLVTQGSLPKHRTLEGLFASIETCLSSMAKDELIQESCDAAMLKICVRLLRNTRIQAEGATVSSLLIRLVNALTSLISKKVKCLNHRHFDQLCRIHRHFVRFEPILMKSSLIELSWKLHLRQTIITVAKMKQSAALACSGPFARRRLISKNATAVDGTVSKSSSSNTYKSDRHMNYDEVHRMTQQLIEAGELQKGNWHSALSAVSTVLRESTTANAPTIPTPVLMHHGLSQLSNVGRWHDAVALVHIAKDRGIAWPQPTATLILLLRCCANSDTQGKRAQGWERALRILNNTLHLTTAPSSSSLTVTEMSEGLWREMIPLVAAHPGVVLPMLTATLKSHCDRVESGVIHPDTSLTPRVCVELCRTLREAGRWKDALSVLGSRAFQVGRRLQPQEETLFPFLPSIQQSPQVTREVLRLLYTPQGNPLQRSTSQFFRFQRDEFMSTLPPSQQQLSPPSPPAPPLPPQPSASIGGPSPCSFPNRWWWDAESIKFYLRIQNAHRQWSEALRGFVEWGRLSGNPVPQLGLGLPRSASKVTKEDIGSRLIQSCVRTGNWKLALSIASRMHHDAIELNPHAVSRLAHAVQKGHGPDDILALVHSQGFSSGSTGRNK